MAAHSSHNNLSMHSILSVFVYSYHYFFSKQKKVIVCAFNHYHFVPNNRLLFVVLILYPRPKRSKKKQKRKMKIDAPMYSMDRVKFPFNFLTALLLSKHVLRFLLRFPLTFKPSEL